MFDALADPTRRAIVERLSASPYLTISELASHFPISRQAETKHLALLESAGPIVIETRGRERHISLRPHALDVASTWLDEVDRQWDDRLAALKDHLTAS
ncbi:metalloregulator ArsR/SmtB family transcription factor [soil metagenome]